MIVIFDKSFPEDSRIDKNFTEKYKTYDRLRVDACKLYQELSIIIFPVIGEFFGNLWRNGLALKNARPAFKEERDD